MNGTTTPSQPQRSGGCLGKGCATFFGLLVFLAIALVGGTFWGIHYLRNNYSSTEPLSLPMQIETEDAPAPLPGEPAATPVPLPQARKVEAEWKAFEKAADRNQRARIELTAGEINGLLAASKNTRGKAAVSILNDVGRVTVSIPLKGVPMMEGRYLNGEASVESSPDGDPKKARISNIILAGKPVPETVLDQSLFGAPSVRTAINRWLDEQAIATFRIENNRAIGETRQ